MTEIDATIIGGGIVGCATAARLAQLGLATVLIERGPNLAGGVTSRNSEVAHGGMYYPTGSLKARCCVAGRRLLKAFCAEAGVAYRECGKLIVAVTEAEEAALADLLRLGRANDVEDLRLVAGAELKRLIPDVRAQAGLLSPRTGILDAEGTARAYADLARQHGAQILTGARVDGIEPAAGRWQVSVAAGDDGRRDGWRHDSRIVVNAAGLRAAEVAALAGIDVAGRGWLPCPVKGNYFSIADRHAGRIDKLVYPLPPADRSSLGVHVCLDRGGRLRLGPDTETLIDPAGPGGETLAEVAAVLDDAAVYAVDPGRGDAFFAAASRFLPWLERDDLTPDFAGIRPRLSPTGFQDFIVHRETGDRAGLVNLIAIDSPGLTSAPALAAEVAAGVAEYLS